MEYNFSLFWGLAIQAYEATLVSDQTPVDRFFRGDSTALSPAAVRGLNVFQGKGDCTECHRGPALTSASTLEVAGGDPGENGTELDKLGRWVDVGFDNIGVRPTAEDPGLGGVDGTPAANPLSVVRLIGGLGTDAVDGTFKVPGLRNVELTAPYFHNGGALTLRQVVDFYNRGGDFPNAEKSPDLQPLGLTDGEKDDLVEFLKSLTDPRVKNQSAPFDHPELYVPVGEKADPSGDLLKDTDGRAVDCFKQVRATGAAGGAPLAPFPTFTGPTCDPAPDLHNPAPVPPDPAPSAPAPSAPAPGVAAPASQVQGSVARSAARCVVPRLRGRTVGQAKRVLSRSQCKLGLVLTPRGARAAWSCRASARAPARSARSAPASRCGCACCATSASERNIPGSRPAASRRRSQPREKGRWRAAPRSSSTPARIASARPASSEAGCGGCGATRTGSEAGSS